MHCVQAGRKKNWRQKGICKKEESKTADREEYTGRRNEGHVIGRILQSGGMNTTDREEYAGRRKEGQETGRQLKKARPDLR
jgi:hypothetical protein